MPDEVGPKRTVDREESNSIANLQREMMGLQHASSPTPIAKLLGSDEHQCHGAEDSSFRELQERATQLIQAGSLTNASQQRQEELDTQTPISSPNKSRVASSSDPFSQHPTTGAGDTSNASEEADESTRPTSTPARSGATHQIQAVNRGGAGDGIWNKQMLLSSIESVRLLVQAFEKQNALRKVELEQVLIEARDAEQRLGEMQQGQAEESVVA